LIIDRLAAGKNEFTYPHMVDEMTPLGVRSAYSAIIVCLLGMCASCSHQGAATAAGAKKHAKPKAEESFQAIIETFRRRMEETPVGFVVTNSNGRSTMTGSNKVSYELFPPKTEKDPYKATITVRSQSRYSVKVSSETADDSGHEKSNNKNDRLASDKDQKGSEAFDSSFGKNATDSSKSNPQSTHVTEQVLPHTDVEEHKYDLIYQDGRWVLVTELNKETEQAIQNAFKSAFETQS
jgi:hypothetical protein